jgi:hypothetical protein
MNGSMHAWRSVWGCRNKHQSLLASAGYKLRARGLLSAFNAWLQFVLVRR